MKPERSAIREQLRAAAEKHGAIDPDLVADLLCDKTRKGEDGATFIPIPVDDGVRSLLAAKPFLAKKAEPCEPGAARDAKSIALAAQAHLRRIPRASWAIGVLFTVVRSSKKKV
jgi:hypothetical protein